MPQISPLTWMSLFLYFFFGFFVIFNEIYFFSIYISLVYIKFKEILNKFYNWKW